jgi:hypothetical protein
MQERHQRDERLQGVAEGKPAGDVRESRDLDLHRPGVLRLGGLPLGPDWEELDDPVIPHAELRRKVPGLVSLFQVGSLRGVQDEVRSGDGQANEGGHGVAPARPGTFARPVRGAPRGSSRPESEPPLAFSTHCAGAVYR